MEPVGNSFIHPQGLSGVVRERYDRFSHMLSLCFQPVQIAIILNPFIQMGIFDECDDLREYATLATQLKNFWSRKVWDSETAEAFQILILTRPELEGVKTIFAAHPAFSKLMDQDDNNDVIIRRHYPEITMRDDVSFMNDNNKDSKGKEEFNDSDESDDELIVVPRLQTNVRISSKAKFQTFNKEFVDRDEIGFIPIENGRLGIMYTLHCDCLDFNSVRIGHAFDLLRAVYSEEPCIIRITSMNWTKEIYTQAMMWTNLSEQLLPCDDSIFPITITVVALSQDDIIEFIKIKGVYLKAVERLRNQKFIASEEFSPYDYGFY